MNFFKSILLDDPDPSKQEISHEQGPNSAVSPPHEDRNPDDVAQDSNADGWSFGGLIKTLATRSESVIETYRRDLKEFGSGLKKESEIIREATSRAVKDLPASLEAGTSAAQGVLDGVLKSTAEIISNETLVFASDGELETPETNRSLNSGRYSWFESQLSAIQSDLNTFCEEPEDVEEYKNWKLRFELENKKDEIEELIGENETLEGVYEKVVPSAVDHETFWCRYFYRVDKLKQQESVRANLVKRAISVDDDDDELSWDVDDDDDDDDEYKNGNGSELTNVVNAKGGSDGSLNPVENDGSRDEKERGDKNNVIESSKKSDEDVSLDEKEVKSDEKVNAKESGEESDVCTVSNHQAKMEEEDMSWDEIEDIGSGDEKKFLTTTLGGRSNSEDLRKQVNVEEDDEDLSWDIEDDDEPVKS